MSVLLQDTIMLNFELSDGRGTLGITECSLRGLSLDFTVSA